MKNKKMDVVTTLLVFCIFCILECNQQLAGFENKNVLEKMTTFIGLKKWKNVLLITDCNENTVVSRHFSKFFIYITILKSEKGFLSRSLINFVNFQHQNQIIIWCKISCLRDIINHHVQENFFHKKIHWLLYYQSYNLFTKDSLLISNYIRVDSIVYLLLPLANNSWVISQVQYKTSNEANLPVKRKIQINSENELLIERDFSPILQNVVVIASVFHFPPQSYVFSTGNGTIKVKSVRHNILEALSQYLGFRIDYRALTTDVDPINAGIWNIQRKVLKEKKVNMTGVFFPVNLNDLMNFTPSCHTFSVRLILVFKNIKYYSRSKKLSSSYLKPFSANVWLSIFIIFIIGTSLAILSTFTPLLPLQCHFLIQNWYNLLNQIIENILSTFPFQGFHVDRVSISTKILITILILFNLMIVHYYNSVLTAVLSADKYKIPFESLSDMVKDGRFTFGTVIRTPMDFLIKNTKSESFKEMHRKSKYSSLESTTECYEKTLQDNFVFICPDEFCGNVNCSFAILKKSYLPYNVAIHFPKFSPFAESFSRGIMHLRSSGILAKITDSSVRIHRPECELSNDYLETVKLSQCLMPFVVLLIGFIMSAVTLFLEYFIKVKTSL